MYELYAKELVRERKEKGIKEIIKQSCNSKNGIKIVRLI